MKIQAKITLITAIMAIVASAVAFGFTVVKYFSPNNDGTRDVLVYTPPGNSFILELYAAWVCIEATISTSLIFLSEGTPSVVPPWGTS